MRKFSGKVTVATDWLVEHITSLVIAAVIAGLFFNNVGTGTLGIVLLVLAGVFVLTSLVSFCPLYASFGIRTCRIDHKGA